MNTSTWFKSGLFILVALLSFYLIILLYVAKQTSLAILMLVVSSTFLFIFFNKRAVAYRYIYPAVMGMVVFIVFPMIVTIGISFTNYSASNIQSLEGTQRILLTKTYSTGDEGYGFKLHQKDENIQLVFDGFVSPVININQTEKELEGLVQDPQPDFNARPITAVIANKELLKSITLNWQGKKLRLDSLRAFVAKSPKYELLENDQIKDLEHDFSLTLNKELGFYLEPDGTKIAPGFKVGVGLDNYTRVFTDEKIRGPFLQIFVWTFVFAGLSVVITLVLGMVLAVVIDWEALRFRSVYRVLLILPYAVPAFISILVFKGLFNQNFGEINSILSVIFGIKPNWFSDTTLAKIMLLIVNSWLGYPYMMILALGLLKAIPSDLYEASAMDGASPLQNFLFITMPLLIKPMMPLLIASFAFNFNNFVLINLLTEGSPDIIGAVTPAGTTDLLVSYTFRIAFEDSGQAFGFAAAIAVLIFALVGLFSIINMKLTKLKI